MTMTLDMTANRHWLGAGAASLVVHAALIGVVAVGFSHIASAPEIEPVVVVELPPLPAIAETRSTSPVPSPVDRSRPTAQDLVTPSTPVPPIEVPRVNSPLPSNPITLPPPEQPLPAPARAQPAPTAAPVPLPAAAPTPATAGSSNVQTSTPGNDPKAKAAEADYFSLVSAHLKRRKQYPAEAKKAQQQGVVTVRFTVSRDGQVSGVSIKKSSGHPLLDQATLNLMQRVAPLPRFPRSMTKDSVTVSLPIDYSLRTS